MSEESTVTVQIKIVADVPEGTSLKELRDYVAACQRIEEGPSDMRFDPRETEVSFLTDTERDLLP